MALFTTTAVAVGKGGEGYCIYFECDTHEECEEMIERLGLTVCPFDSGELIKQIDISVEELRKILKGLRKGELN